MKWKKLIKKTRKTLDPKKRKSAVKRKHLKKLIRKLRKYERKTIDELGKTRREKEKKRLKTRIVLAHAQRKKALGILKDLSEKKKK